MASERDPDGDETAEGQALDRTWIKLKSASGSIGFVKLADLITPQQLEAKKQSNKKLSMLEAELDTVKRSGVSVIPAGVYSLGGTCDAGFATHINTMDFLSNKVLVWEEAGKLHFVHVLDPLAQVVYDILNDNRTVELQGFGYVQMKTFRSEQDTALMGYKDKLLWFTVSGTQFDSYQLCGPETNESILSMLKIYARQRPPEELGINTKPPTR